MCLLCFALLSILLVHWAALGGATTAWAGGCNAYVSSSLGNETKQTRFIINDETEITTAFKRNQGRLERLQDNRDALKIQVETRKYADRRDQVRWEGLN